MIVLVLFGLVLALFILDRIFKYNARYVREIPGMPENYIIGCARYVLRSPVGLFNLGRELARKHNGIYSFWALHIQAVNIYNPDDIETVISGMKHSDKSPVYNILKPWLQQGLLLSAGSKWQSRRKILTPTFHFSILKQFWPILEENGQRLVEALKATGGKPVDVIPVISEYTLTSICETAMGTQLHEDITNAGKTYKDAIYKLGELCVDRFTKVYYISDFVFNMSKLGRKFYVYLDVVQSFTKRVIKERKDYIDKYGLTFDVSEETSTDDVYLSKKKKKIAMLDLLVSAEREGSIDKAGIQEEVDTFMFEGHDTTAAGLTYCLMVLANNKHVQDKIVEELEGIFGDSDRHATMEDLTNMRYLECCIKESLRLYPPVPFISRELTETTVLSNFTVPKGTSIHIHIYDLHRREDLFKDAEVFDPDRFLPENSFGRHMYAYIPFSAGPRNCIGQRFAMMEMKSCVAGVLRRFRLEPVTRPQDLEFISDIVLRNNKPVYVKFVERK